MNFNNYLLNIRIKQLVFSLAIILFVCHSTCVKSQNTVNTHVGVVILQPILIKETAPLHFGAMSIPETQTDVILSTTKVRSATSPSGISLVDQPPFSSNATYTVAGSANATYAIDLPSGAVTLSNGSASNNITVINFKARSSSSNVDGPSGTLSSSGEDSFSVGATLQLASSQPSGTYTGAFTVTINYN